MWAALSEVSLLPPPLSHTVVQVICVLYMRDSLLMTITTILVHSDKLKTWQLAKLPKCESPKGWGIARLFGYSSVKEN